jgi:hypothetical protein
MTRFMLIVTACLLAVPLACGKSESTPAPAAKAPAASAPAAKAPAADAAGAAAATTAGVAATPINANCPIGGEPIAADGGTVAFKGKTVGFCCPKCVAKFEALDDAGKIAALEKNGTKLPQ